MTNPTPRQELVWLGTQIERGLATPGDRDRFQVLFEREVSAALRPVIADLQQQLPAIEAEARRRAAIRREAVEAGRRAGIAAGRQAAQEQQQRRQPPMSAAQREARDRILRQKR